MADIKLIKTIIKGLLTYIPGVTCLLDKKKVNTRHSGAQAEFCYTLWLSLLVHFNENGLAPAFEKVGELGSGGSVGVGICALLAGTKQYFALEIENHYDRENNLKLLDEIIALFKNKTPISNQFKQLNLQVTDYNYPSHLITPKFLDNNFIEELRKEINSNCLGSKYLNIVYDWQNKPSLYLDLIFSRAVMEHVNDPYSIYKQLSSNLIPNAYQFHDIEFHSHGITSNKKEYLNISQTLWKIISGKRAYFLNRWSLQDHLFALENLNYNVIKTQELTEPESDFPNEVLTGATILVKLNDK